MRLQSDIKSAWRSSVSSRRKGDPQYCWWCFASSCATPNAVSPSSSSFVTDTAEHDVSYLSPCRDLKSVIVGEKREGEVSKLTDSEARTGKERSLVGSKRSRWRSRKGRIMMRSRRSSRQGWTCTVEEGDRREKGGGKEGEPA